MKKTRRNRSMSDVQFRVMAAIMHVRGLFRDKKKEVLLSGVGPGDVLLDFGCGLGFSTLPAAKIVGENGKVYALDIHPLAIKMLEGKIGKHGLENVETIHAGLAAGIPDETVDRVLLFNVLPMIEDRPAAVREIFRVLRRGGVLAVKSGLGSELCGGRVDTGDLTTLMRDNGPLELKQVMGKFRIFEKM